MYLRSPPSTHTRSGLSHWCRWRCSHRAARRTRWCRFHSCSPESQAHRNSGTLPQRLHKLLRSDRALMNTRWYLPHRSSLQTPVRTDIQNPLVVIHKSRCSCRGHRCSQSHAFCSPILQTQEDICRSIHWAGRRTESGVRSRGCSDTRPPLLCSYRPSARLGRCSDILWYQGCWYSLHTEQRSRHHKAYHSFCPCTARPLWHRCRRNPPWCLHK